MMDHEEHEDFAETRHDETVPVPASAVPDAQDEFEPRGSTNTVDLWICRGFSGEVTRVSVDTGLRVEQAIPDIADQIGYFTTDWEKIGMYNLTRDFEYDLSEKFSQTKTEPGDMVIMADGAACHK